MPEFIVKTRRLLFLSSLLIGLTAAVPSLAAQGCSQCRDTVSQTNPGVQASYRRAILILIAAVSGFALTTTLVLRRMQ